MLAGMVGFEPTIYCTKNSCPTARPHPNTGALVTPEQVTVQDRKRKNILSFLRRFAFQKILSFQILALLVYNLFQLAFGTGLNVLYFYRHVRAGLALLV